MHTRNSPVKSRVSFFAAFAFLLAGAAIYLYLFPGDAFPRIFTSRLEQTLGVAAEARGMEIDPVRGIIEIKGLTLSNPKGFPGREMAFVRRLRMEISPRSFLTAKNEIAVLEIDAETVTIVKNSFKALNVQALPARDASLRIGRLDIKIKEIIFLDYSSGETPLVQILPVQLETSHEGVRGLAQAVYLIMSDVLKIPAVAGLDLSKGQPEKLPPPLQVIDRGLDGTAWTLEETARGTASAVFGGLRATSGKIADLFAPRAGGSPLPSRIGESPSGRDAPAGPAAQ